ncbi:hypothetical protein FHP25_34520 [Vineibacter terrae]|uniref:Leucine-binding protein domain-containing protein n=1 Tax=Vineibacter terrae TaxID=2586908 RepID=A0A5C8P9H2_9HYPH|nr:ABC transporter substrate-binding protein [Vineibacter terrae]TXL70441.1 hypothetical protein FHP25_34520 [Vineibacter terrae]
MTPSGFSRRSVLQALAASGCVAPGFAWAQAAAGDLNIALLSQNSGNFATHGEVVFKGATIALEERGHTILGRKINLLRRDDEGKPAIGVRRLTELVETSQVKFFIGNASSAVGLAESEIAAREKIVQYAGGGSDEFTGARCNPYTFQWSASPYTASSTTLEYVRKAHPNAKRVYTLTVDYAFGHSLLKYTREAAPELGFELAGNDMHPLGERQYTQYFNKALAVKPDVILLLTAGSDFLAAVRQLSSYGLKKVIVAAPWAAELDELKELTPQMRAGLILGLNYHSSINTPVNKAFVAAAAKRYQMLPTYAMAYAYDTFRTIFLAMEKAKSVDSTAVARVMEGMQLDSVHGPTSIDARTHQTNRPYYVCLCKQPDAQKNDQDIADLVFQGDKPQPAALNQCSRT